MASYANIIRLPSNQDAELIRLGEELRISWLKEMSVADAYESEFNDACAASSAIVAKIEASAAHTIAGLRVKAIAVLWCRVGDDPGETTDERLIRQIVFSLLDM